ncbi:UNVERIFIED_CONTAM: hypothetical protein NCL1_39377 [Trichonephila clavipes]
MKSHHSITVQPITMKIGISSPPGNATAYQPLQHSINRRDANMVAKNDANLALSPTFRYQSLLLPNRDQLKKVFSKIDPQESYENCMRAGDEPRNYKPWSGDKDNTIAETTLSKIPNHANLEL